MIFYSIIGAMHIYCKSGNIAKMISEYMEKNGCVNELGINAFTGLKSKHG